MRLFNKKPANMSFDARKTALVILNTLDKESRTLDCILDELFIDDSMTSKRDRGLLQALVYGVLRWKGRLDYIIAHFSNTRFDKIDPGVLNILRLALFQIIYLDRIPDSAAVNTAVDMCKKSTTPWIAGYVNALLRKASQAYQKISYPDTDKNAILALAVTKSFPEWIIRRWLDRYGSKNTAKICDAVNTIPPISIRTNTLKTSPQELADDLAKVARQVSNMQFSPDGITFVNPRTAIPDLTVFKAGWFQVQDEAAQLVSLLLDPQAGETVLDACAGLGGKTGHIAQLMANTGTVVALDVDRYKLARLDAEMKRLGISTVSTLCHNLDRPLQHMPLKGFDRILLDAPCSGLGVMRRNPDIKWQKSKKNLLNYQTRQLRYLMNLAPLVKPSGILSYAVCSPEPEENEAVVDQFLKKHTEFVIDKSPGKLPGSLNSLVASTGIFKTFPNLSQMDGFFSVRLLRMPCL
jgi:16S rRNA (cytosine967-C5)-methyltransferase